MSSTPLFVNIHQQWLDALNVGDARPLIRLAVERALTDRREDTRGPGKRGQPYRRVYKAINDPLTKQGLGYGPSNWVDVDAAPPKLAPEGWSPADYRREARAAVTRAYEDHANAVIPAILKRTGKKRPDDMTADYRRIYRAARRTFTGLDWAQMRDDPIYAPVQLEAEPWKLFAYVEKPAPTRDADQAYMAVIRGMQAMDKTSELNEALDELDQIDDIEQRHTPYPGMTDPQKHRMDWCRRVAVARVNGDPPPKWTLLKGVSGTHGEYDFEPVSTRPPRPVFYPDNVRTETQWWEEA